MKFKVVSGYYGLSTTLHNNISSDYEARRLEYFYKTAGYEDVYIEKQIIVEKQIPDTKPIILPFNLTFSSIKFNFGL